MKTFIHFITIFLISTFTLSLSSQDIVVLNFMKVKPGKTNDYLEIEKEWKELQEKKIEAGIMYSWQLSRKMFSAEDDSDQYITVDSYSDFSKTKEVFPDGFFDGFKTEEEWSELMDKTSKSRKLANKMVLHLSERNDNQGFSNYILVNRMKALPGMENEYTKLEKEIWKPIHEESIKKEFRSSWSLWSSWPFDENENYFFAVDGYEKFEQIGANSADFSEVHPDLDLQETIDKTMMLRKQISAEIWELVDYAQPKED